MLFVPPIQSHVFGESLAYMKDEPLKISQVIPNEPFLRVILEETRFDVRK